MKITMYTLLGLVKDGKAPKKIKYIGYIFEYDTNHKRYESYFDEQIWTLNDFVNVDDNLNEEVEILEEEKKTPTLNDIRESYGLPRIEEKKIPEKIETYKDGNNDIFLDDLCYKYMPIHKDSLSFNEQVIVDKLNDVLDYLKSKGE